MQGAVTVRFVNDDERRRYLVQRQDGKLWTGRRWTRNLRAARLYARLRDAQAVCTRIQRRRVRGMRRRDFNCILNITVHGDQPFTVNDLRRYLRAALLLCFNNSTEDDGPLGAYVEATALLSTLAEATPKE